MPHAICLVDDEPHRILPWVQALKEAGYAVDQLVSPGEAIRAFDAPVSRDVPDLLIWDLMMPPDDGVDAARTGQGTRTGLQVYEAYKARNPGGAAILLTHVRDDDLLARHNARPRERAGRKRYVMPQTLVGWVKELIG